ncbi:LysR family transcriptional regulator [Pseudolysinimonas sp.]|jgi:DNA-binding transcriptional LysR family regulator|uniref:LysR family transcriptional regulator n=1 Tax=Pseudolysinimonas sp. TaxID=2680009 RepID=UPI003782D27D
MALNLWRLRLLDVFARVGTVRATAAELVMSPSAVSQQLTLLEAETGAVLFERAGRRMTLTATGDLLAERARGLLDQADAVDAELSDLASGPVGRVRVGGFASAISSTLIPAVRRLAHLNPHLELELLEIEPREATTALLQGRIDLAVTVDEGDGTLLAPTIAVVPLSTDPLLAVLPVGHELASRARVSLADLAAEPWALDHEGTYLGELVPRECRLAGFEPRVVGRFSSYGVMLAHVASGRSVAVLPALAVDAAPDVVARPVAGLADRRIVIAMRTGAARRGAIIAVVEALRASTAPHAAG